MSDGKIPPAPPGWNKTISDLIAEMKLGEKMLVHLKSNGLEITSAAWYRLL